MLEWTEGARNVYAAAAQSTGGYTGIMSCKSLAGAIMQLTGPDRSLIGRVLLDPAVWPVAQRATIRDLAVDFGAGHHIADLRSGAEQRARQEGVLRVGERHLADQMVEWWRSEFIAMQFKPEEFQQRVREAELGTHFTDPELSHWWHGMIDANTIIQAKPLHNIPWPQVTKHDRVMLWVAGTLLNELDGMTYYHNSARVRKRVKGFTRFLRDRLEDALQPMGITVQAENVRLTVWAPAVMNGARDTDHLEAAIDMRERGLPVHLVTQDLGLAARAMTLGIAVFRLPDEWLEEPEPTPHERDMEHRIRGLEQQIERLNLE